MSAMYLVLAAVVTLSAFLVTLALASAVLGVVTPRLLHAVARHSPLAQSRALFAALAFPSALAVGVASVGVLVPFVIFEPLATDERAPVSLSVLAVAGAGMLCLFVSKLVRSWRATEALRRAWMARARPLGEQRGLEVFGITELFPVVAVIGIRRPVLFVSERVLESCPRNEIAAMMAHERAHVRTRDNLRQLVLNACADFVPRSRQVALLRAWQDATEKAADSAAADRGETSLVDLASALVSVGRLAESGTSMPSVSSAFYSGPGFESRVRRLLQRDAATEPATRSLASSIIGVAFAMVVAMLAAAPLVHEGTEALIEHLP